MNRHAQRAERDDVRPPRASVEAPTATGLAQQDDDPVVLIDELARMLHTSVSTIKRALRARTFFIPEMRRIDKRHRWSRDVVLDHIRTSHTLKFQHGSHGKAGLSVVQRKGQGEGARER